MALGLLPIAALGAGAGALAGTKLSEPRKGDLAYFAAFGAGVASIIYWWRGRKGETRVGQEARWITPPGGCFPDLSTPEKVLRMRRLEAEAGFTPPWYHPDWWYRGESPDERHSPLPNTADAFANWFIERIDAGEPLPRRVKAPPMSREHWEAIDRALKRNGERAARDFTSRCRQIGRLLSDEEYLLVKWTTPPGHGLLLNPQVMPDGTVVDGGCPNMAGEFGDFHVVGYLRDR
jgi:hypothetical protein